VVGELVEALVHVEERRRGCGGEEQHQPEEVTAVPDHVRGVHGDQHLVEGEIVRVEADSQNHVSGCDDRDRIKGAIG
jgi:hypothetical protein